MSMMSWSEDGFGFKLYGDFKKLKSFVIENGAYPDDKKADMYKTEDESELSEYTGDPIPWVIAEIINKQEGKILVKGYRSCGDTDQEAMLGIEPDYPWSPQKFESQDEAISLLEKYANILGITEKPDYFTAYYYG